MTAEPTTDKILDMDAVCVLLKKAGITAYVAQTGGGTATIYAEPTTLDEHGDTRFAACAGPGHFNGPGWTNPVGFMADAGGFCVGPDDDGQAEPWFASSEDDEQTVADHIAAQVAASVTAWTEVDRVNPVRAEHLAEMEAAARDMHNAAVRLDRAWTEGMRDDTVPPDWFAVPDGYPFGKSFDELLWDIARFADAIAESRMIAEGQA